MTRDALGAMALTGPARATGSLAADDVAALRAGLQGALLSPRDAGYEDARKLWNGAFDHHPALIARCAHADDVAQCVQFARAQELLVAVRGGGHSFPGFSGCDGGLVIDLTAMRRVRVDRNARTVRIDPGVLLGELDRAALAEGLVTSTGTVSHTGAAGLTLGGGFGRLARKLGLACDNLLGAEVVSADARQLRANARENPDLYWALRGGGGNFGVVTSFEYQLHAVPPSIIGGVMGFAFSKPRELLRAYADFASTVSDEFFAMLDIVPMPGKRVAFFDVCHCGARADAERELGTLRKIGTVTADSMRESRYLDLQVHADADYPAGRGYYLKSGFVRTLGSGLIDTLADFLESAPAPRCIASIGQLGGAIARVKPTDTAYWHREATHQVMLVGFWDTPEQAVAPRQWVRSGWQRLEPHTEGFYTNLMARDESAARIRKSFGENYDRLAGIKQRFDPDNFFRLNANIPPRASRGAQS